KKFLFQLGVDDQLGANLARQFLLFLIVPTLFKVSENPIHFAVISFEQRNSVSLALGPGGLGYAGGRGLHAISPCLLVRTTTTDVRNGGKARETPSFRCGVVIRANFPQMKN